MTEQSKRGRGRPTGTTEGRELLGNLRLPPDQIAWLKSKGRPASKTIDALIRAEMEREMSNTLGAWLRSLPDTMVVDDGADKWAPCNLIDALDAAELDREVAGTREADGTGVIHFLDDAGYQISPAAYTVRIAD